VRALHDRHDVERGAVERDGRAPALRAERCAAPDRPTAAPPGARRPNAPSA
jgi:hypothetical protein